MLKIFRSFAPAAFAAVALGFSLSSFAEGEAQVEDMNAYKCKDVMRMSGEDRDVAMAVLHGYMLGKKGVVSFVPAELGKASNDFIEYCLDHPADNAMETFAKFAK